MFKRKQDVDKHVAAVLSRRRDEKEKQAQGFQIARLYSDIKEYSIAKRYLSGFLLVRENAPQAHQLMGEINEGLGEKDEAIENYKRALNLGSHGSSNRQLIMKICELYYEQGTDIERMKYWCDQCEKIFPKSDIVFKLKTQIAEASNGQPAENSKEMENLVVSELLNHPTDLKLRIKLLNLYIDSGRYEEAYDAGISTDLTTAFNDRLPWFEYLQTVFQRYSEKFSDSMTDLVFNQHYLHILRNITYLSLGSREVNECVQNLQRFDQQLNIADSMTSSEEEWFALLQEMKGQIFFLAGLILLKRAQTGSISWQDVNQLCGVCFLASRSVDPIDPQAPWFVSSPQSHSKFYNWWSLQSYDRLSQVGHMLLQLSQNDFVEWSKGVRQSMMTPKGRDHVFSVLYAPRDAKSQGQTSFLYQAKELVESSDLKEPVTVRHMIDIDRVAHQVHISSLSHLVWLCLQRYHLDMNAQPNYHFNLVENIQYSTKNMETGTGESLCQLDILVFLLASVQCAASALAEKSMLMYDENKGRPLLLPICLSKPLCTHEQEEWWTAAFKFCTNSIKDDFSRLRRVLVRGIETVRLIGPHGMSVSLITHIARSLDAKIKSSRQAEYGSRLPPQDLATLEQRAVFYWEKAKQALQKLQRNHNSPIPKIRLFKEPGDMDIPPRLIDKYLSEAVFALSLAAWRAGQFETALEGFEADRSVHAKFYCAQILKSLADKESVKDDMLEVDTGKKQALVFKARDYLFDVLDMLDGDKTHDLNVQVSKELDDLETKIHDLELASARGSSFITPTKSLGYGKGSSAHTNGVSYSTPRNEQVTSWYRNGPSEVESGTDMNHSSRDPFNDGHTRPRPSPERLDLQIKSLSYSQASLFKMVMDRNEELIMINGKMMEELRDNNNQLKNVLTENKSLMEELKTFLGENREMMKQIKTELSSLKPSIVQSAQAQVSPATPLFVSHIPTPQGPRGPFPGFPAQAPVVPMAYSNYSINSTGAPQTPAAGAQFQTTGLPGLRPSNVGKYRPQSEEDEEEEEDLSNLDEAQALYREYLDSEQSYTQFYTPESQLLQDLSHTSRPGIDAQQALFQPRLSIAPGYFASALRGQSLQYAQASQTPGQVKPTTPGPGFFSSPSAAGVGAPGTPAGIRMPPTLSAGTPLLTVTSPTIAVDSSAQSPALMAALTGQQRSITTGNVKADVVAASSVGPSASGIQPLFQSKAVLEPKKLKGDLSIIVDAVNNRGTILMMGETKEILFHHDINKLKLEPCFAPTQVIWTGVKVGSLEAEKVLVSLQTPALAQQLKEAIHRASTLIQTKVSSQGVISTTPKIPGTITATSTPIPVATFKPTPSMPAGKDEGKYMLGGFSFMAAPNIQAAPDKDKVEPHKPQPQSATNKSETAKPFAGFSFATTSNASTKSDFKFQSPGTGDAAKAQPSATSIGKTQSPLSGQKSSSTFPKSPGMAVRSPGGAGEDEHMEEYEPNVDFKPAIALPELVEKKTGEENETEVFVERCRMFRYDPETKQWKERGVGEMKILRSKDQVKYRIVMRRDQILKLCANHFLNAEMKLTPMAASDRSWCYSASDFSEEEIKHEQLAVKFKTAEKAKLFHEKFNECCRQLREAAGSRAESVSSGSTTSKQTQAPKVAAPSSSSASSSSNSRSLSEMFKPEQGSWKCQGCFIQNKADVTKCPACQTSKPGSKPEAAAVAAAPSLTEMFKPSVGSWECEGCLLRNGGDVTKCPACGALKPGSKPDTAPTSAGVSSLAEMFKPSVGSWECEGCFLRNNGDVTKCPACQTLKPGAKPGTVTKDQTKTGFKFGTKASSGPPETGFKFGTSTTSSAPPPTSGGFIFKNTSAPSGTTNQFEGFKFAAPTTTAATTPPATGFTFKPTGVTTTTTTTTTTAATSPPATGFTFKPTGVTTTTTTTAATSPPVTGFTFKPTGVTTTTTTTAATSPPATGFTLKPTEAAATTTTTTAATTTPPTTGFTFKPTTGVPASTPAPSTSAASTTPTSGFVFKPTSTAASSTTVAAATTESGSIFNTITNTTKSGFTIGASASTTTSTTAPATGAPGFNFGAFNISSPAKAGPPSGLLAKLLTSDESAVEESLGAKPKTIGGFSFSMAPKANTAQESSGGQAKGFQFSFTKTPPKSQGSAVVPSSPEVDEHGMYVNKDGDDSHIHFEPLVKLPERFEVKTGEEGESILFESRGKMYRFVFGEWKEKGVGVVKILQHKDSKKTRILMRRDQVLKICCNHKIEPALSLQPMPRSDGKAWVWYAMDFSEDEGKMEQLAVRFRTTEIAAEFKRVFDLCRGSAVESPPNVEQQGPPTTGAAIVKKELFKDLQDATDGSDGDVIFVREDKPTPEQLAKARKYLLPDAFYLYVNKPPCPGCIGCGDGELPADVAPPRKPADQKQSKSPAEVKSKINEPAMQGSQVFGAAVKQGSQVFGSSSSQGSQVFGDGVKQGSQVFGGSSAQGSQVFGAAVKQGSQVFGDASNLPDFASLTSDAPADKTGGGFMFGSGSGVDFSSLAASSGKSGEFTWKHADSLGPFKFAGAGQKLFGASTSADGDGNEAEGDESGVEPSADVHFEPVIPLPELVKVKTGEEDWTPLFCHRAKLYKFDNQVSQWKERGIGDIKIMKHNSKVLFRVLQRREQVLKVSCNHLLTTEMKIKPMATSETSWCWIANDMTEGEPTVEQFAVKFKDKDIALQFKQVFESCQEQLQHISSERPVKDTSSASDFQDSGTRGVVQHSLSFDIAMQDTIVASAYVPKSLMQGKGITEGGQKKKSGNGFQTKGSTVSEPAVESLFVTPLGDRGNIYHTKALNVSDADTITASSYTSLGEGNVEPSLTLTSVTPLGDRGNIYHTKALDVSDADAITSSSYTSLGKQKVEPVVTSKSVTPLGDRGNIYHTKALDVTDADVNMTSSYASLGKQKVEPALTSKSVTPLGDRGNIYHTKALDVSDADTVIPSIYASLGKEKVEAAATSKSVTPLGDKGNVHHTRALDVSDSEAITPSTYASLGKGKLEGSLTSKSVTPLGDKGNVHHTKALDVSDADVVTPSSYTSLGKGKIEPAVTLTSVTPLGDRGNIYHTKALDVGDADAINPSSYTSLGKGKIEPAVTSKSVTPLGDKGNVHHTKALDVSDADMVTPSSYTSLGKGKIEPAVTSKSVTPLGDRGNIHHTKALDVIEADTVTPTSYTSLGKQKAESAVESKFVTPLEDRGNIYHTKALDVSDADVITTSLFTLLGAGKVEPALTPKFVTPLGDRGNIHHTKALDVSNTDAITPSSYASLSQGSVEPTGSAEGAVTSKSVTPLGDRGNVHHTKALDVSDADVVIPSSYASLGQGSVEPTGAVTSKFVTPLGDRGNIHHTKALDVSDADVVIPSSYASLDLGSGEPTVTSRSVTPFGDRGNIYHTQALDVAGKDFVEFVNYLPLGDKGNPYHSKYLRTLSEKESTNDQTDAGALLHPSHPGGEVIWSAPGWHQVDAAEAHLGSAQQQDHPQASQEPKLEASNEEDDEEDNEEEEDDKEEDEDVVLFEKRVTLNAFEDGQWKKLGMGRLVVACDEDLNGNSVRFIGDDDVIKCNHIICRENTLQLTKNVCDWKPIDYSTDEPVRRHFMAAFSSIPAAEEFAGLFNESQRLAVESEISEVLLNEMESPVIFSRGESGNKD